MGNSHEASGYRAFVDGLRAVAILAVMAFHVGVPGLTGGFVGVDVFFVISGFLIIGQLEAALASGRHSLVEFWGRRVLRILPPYLLVVGASVALGLHVLVSAEEKQDFFSHVIWSAAMAANHYFLAQQGYFETTADTKPLLHLWSLAVEEQFYLVAPLVLSGLWWLRRRLNGSSKPHQLAALVLAIVSLAACVALTGEGEEPNYAFFVMPLRAWEFIAGGVLASVAERLRGTRVSPPGLVWLGLAMILGAVVGFDESTRFPSYAALLPVVGTSVVIVGGLLDERSLPTRLLATRPVTALGLVSYSWYLWHWPLLAFLRIQNFSERQLGPDSLAALVALVLAILTYWLVERPIRVWRQRTRPTLGWKTTAGGLALCALMAGVGLSYRPEVALAESEADEGEVKKEPTDACVFTSKVNGKKCMEFARSQEREVGLVLGDSHGSRIRAFLKTKPEYENVVFAKATSRACPPIFGVRPESNKGPSWVQACIDRKEQLQAALETGEFKPDFLVLAGYWHMYTAGGSRELVSLTPGQPKPADRDEFFRASLRTTLEDLRALGVPRILVLGPSPNMQKEVPTCAAQAKARRRSVNDVCTVLGKELDETFRTRDLMQAATRGLDGVRFVDSLPTICPARRCVAEMGEELLYLDRHHLSPAALERVHQQNLESFSWVIGP